MPDESKQPYTADGAHEWLQMQRTHKAGVLLDIIDSGLTVCPQSLSSAEPVPCLLESGPDMKTAVPGTPECAGCLFVSWPFQEGPNVYDPAESRFGKLLEAIEEAGR